MPQSGRYDELAKCVADLDAPTTRDAKRGVTHSNNGSTAGIFLESGATLGHVPNVIAVDVTVPDCPRRPNRSLPGTLAAMSASRPRK